MGFNNINRISCRIEKKDMEATIMNRWTFLMATLFAFIIVAVGCSHGGGGPVAPNTADNLSVTTSNGDKIQNHLWGFYDVYIDFPSQTVTANLNRGAMFSANVVTFLNSNPAGLAFPYLKTTPIGTDYVDVDLDVQIQHPLAQALYDGYDVRGILIGDQNAAMKYDTTLAYGSATSSVPVQVMYDYEKTASDIHPGKAGNPDGYTRWWNPSEFTTSGVLGYTPGKLATKGYTGSATLNPYKYYANG
jgi:hypothetical protein